MKKKIAIILTIIICMGLTACGENAENNKDMGKQDVEEEVTTETDVMEETASSEVPVYDFSGFERYTDATCPNGAVLYSDIVDVINTVEITSEPIKIGFVVKHFTTADWVDFKRAVEEEVAKLNEQGAKIEATVDGGINGNDKEGQLAVLRSMIAKNYDVIVVAPISDASLLPGIEEAIAAGITLVTFQAPFDDPYIPYSLSFSFQTQGEAAAQWCAEQLPEGGKVACIMGVADSASAINVTKGFKEWIENHPESKLELVDTQDGQWDRVKGNEIMASWLTQYSDLDAVFAENSAMGLGALEAIKDAGRFGEIKVLSRDGVEEELESIKAGELDATISQLFDIGGRIALQEALLAYNGVELPDRIWINPVIIDSSNVNEDLTSVVGFKEIDYVIKK